VLEVGEDVAGFGHVTLNAVDHGAAFFAGVTGLAEAVVDEGGGGDFGCGESFGFGHAQGYVAGLQQVPGRISEPGGVAKLEGGGQRAGQDGQKIFEQRGIGFQIRRELKKHWAEFACSRQRFDGCEKARNEIFGAFQALDVRDDLMRFDAETEVCGRVLQPVLDGGFFDQLAEGEVYFDGVELGGIVSEKFFSEQVSLGRNRASRFCRPIRRCRRRIGA